MAEDRLKALYRHPNILRLHPLCSTKVYVGNKHATRNQCVWFARWPAQERSEPTSEAALGVWFKSRDGSFRHQPIPFLHINACYLIPLKTVIKPNNASHQPIFLKSEPMTNALILERVTHWTTKANNPFTDYLGYYQRVWIDDLANPAWSGPSSGPNQLVWFTS